jgi:hypothetical protein
MFAKGLTPAASIHATGVSSGSYQPCIDKSKIQYSQHCVSYLIFSGYPC